MVIIKLNDKNIAPRANRARKAQALVEFALVLPFLVVILFGTIETARIMNLYLSLQNIAREAAIFGSQPDPTLSLKPKAVADRTFDLLRNNLPLKFSVNGDWTDLLPGDVIIVDVNHNIDGIYYTKVTISLTMNFILLPNYGGNKEGMIPLSCSAVMLNETQAVRRNSKASYKETKYQIIELAAQRLQKKLN